MQQESSRFRNHFFFKSVVLINPLEPYGQCTYWCLKLTDLKLSHSAINADFCL